MLSVHGSRESHLSWKAELAMDSTHIVPVRNHTSTPGSVAGIVHCAECLDPSLTFLPVLDFWYLLKWIRHCSIALNLFLEQQPHRIPYSLRGGTKPFSLQLTCYHADRIPGGKARCHYVEAYYLYASRIWRSRDSISGLGAGISGLEGIHGYG